MFMILVLLGVLSIASLVLYRQLLPDPIPGIPYNNAAARSIMGDIPAMVEEVKKTGQFRVWCAKQVTKLNSPICQIFVRPPPSRPWVLLADYKESRDILTRRTREFDKSSFLSEGMACMGSFHGIYTTGDKFKSNRQLIQDLMKPSFLNEYLAPRMLRTGERLMEVLESKAEIARGRPFSVKKEFEHTSLDVMLQFAFGDNWSETALGLQMQNLTSYRSTLPLLDAWTKDVDEICEFSATTLPPFLNSVYEAPEVVEQTINSLIPKLQTWWWSKRSWYKRIFEEKEKSMKQQVRIAIRNLHDGQVSTGIEHMLARETARAEKAGQKPDLESKVIRDEMFGNIIGGHHTTSGAMMWLAKCLTENPAIQNKLRTVLFAALPAAKREGRLFTANEIRQARIPYLDAVIEEVLRMNAVPVTREAMCDTTVLGIPIAKGTQVFFMSNGPGYLSPPLSDVEPAETAVAKEDKGSSIEVGASGMAYAWDQTRALSSLDPERWLVRKSEGEGVSADEVDFDAGAGPQLVFGQGPRGCWGRRLAYLEMRIVISMLVWRFRLLEIPQKLVSNAAFEGIARIPQQCYVRLEPLD